MAQNESKVERWCLVFDTKYIGHKVIAPITATLVGEPFDKVGVDVVHMPKTRSGI